MKTLSSLIVLAILSLFPKASFAQGSKAKAPDLLFIQSGAEPELFIKKFISLHYGDIALINCKERTYCLDLVKAKLATINSDLKEEFEKEVTDLIKNSDKYYLANFEPNGRDESSSYNPVITERGPFFEYRIISYVLLKSVEINSKGVQFTRVADDLATSIKESFPVYEVKLLNEKLKSLSALDQSLALTQLAFRKIRPDINSAMMRDILILLHRQDDMNDVTKN